MSASEAAAAFAPSALSEGQSGVEPETLARGLLLVRASALNIVRLQLAMERRDRPVALETVDTLMGIDRQIGDLVGGLADYSDDVAAGSRAMEQQRRVLAVEKVALAAGRSGPLVKGPNRWIEPARPNPVPAEPVRSRPVERAEVEEGWSLSPQLAVALAFLAVFAVAVAFFFLTETGRAVIAAPAAFEGAPR